MRLLLDALKLEGWLSTRESSQRDVARSGGLDSLCAANAVHAHVLCANGRLRTSTAPPPPLRNPTENHQRPTPSRAGRCRSAPGPSTPPAFADLPSNVDQRHGSCFLPNKSDDCRHRGSGSTAATAPRPHGDACPPSEAECCGPLIGEVPRARAQLQLRALEVELLTGEHRATWNRQQYRRRGPDWCKRSDDHIGVNGQQAGWVSNQS